MDTRENTNLDLRDERRTKRKKRHLKRWRVFAQIYEQLNIDTNSNCINDDTSLTFSVATNLSVPEIIPTYAAKQSETDVVNEQVCQAKANQSDSDPKLTVTVEDVNLKHSTESKLSNDTAEWAVDLITYHADNIPPSQHLESDFLLKGRQFSDRIRYMHAENILWKKWHFPFFCAWMRCVTQLIQ